MSIKTKQPKLSKGHRSPQGPTTVEYDTLSSALARTENDCRWVFPAISKAEAKSRWPDRTQATFSAQKHTAGVRQYRATGMTACDDGEDPKALAHFEAIYVGDEGGEAIGEVRVGDMVTVEATEGDRKLGYDWVVQMTELFEDEQGNRLFGVRWFYCIMDTMLAYTNASKGNKKCCPVEWDSRRIFRASEDDGLKGYQRYFSVDVIQRKVTVKHIIPGSVAPSESECDFWWDQEHSRRCSTFVDTYPEGVQPNTAGWRMNGVQRVMNALDLYCGCGGMSFVDHNTPKSKLLTKWAVDFMKSMCATFKCNYPEAQVFESGVDQFVCLCARFEALIEQYPDSWQPSRPPSPGSPVPVITDIRLKVTADYGTNKQEKGNLLEPLTEDNAYVEFLVDNGGEKPQWVPVWNKHMDNLEPAIAKFVQEQRRAHKFPMPATEAFDLRRQRLLLQPMFSTMLSQTCTTGSTPITDEVDLVMGGPPCQGLSGLNRHATQTDILKDARNRQVHAFLTAVRHFQPKFVLMENVVDMMRKGDGVYAKFALATLLNMRYQVRMGCIAAGDQGAPQGRNRLFLMAAKSGEEQLPPFPEPSHNASSLRNPVPKVISEWCLVDLPNDQSRDDALPATVLGDILSDLPEVNNFTFADQAQYRTSAQTPMQLFLRRDPPSWQASRQQRAEAADAIMGPLHAQLQQNMLLKLVNKDREIQDDKLVQLGKTYTIGLTGQANKLQREIFEELKKACKTKKALDQLDKEVGASTWEAHFHLGQKVLYEQMLANEAQGPLRDHRPLCMKYEDALRMEAVPFRQGANFRDMPGVVSHPREAGGTCCVGHTHALRVDGKTACKGGGMLDKPKGAKGTAARVDNYDRDGDRVLALEGCDAVTYFLFNGSLLVPRYALTYKDGKSNGRHGCFGRTADEEIQPTVVGRAEPHNLALLHPLQNRVLTIRENARCQGFPDSFVIVGTSDSDKQPTNAVWCRHKTLKDRYQQLGNAVCPMVASALGRCLALAATGSAPDPLKHPVVAVPDPELQKALADSVARKPALKCYWDQIGVKPVWQNRKLKVGGRDICMEDEETDDDEAEEYEDDDEDQ